MNRNDWFDLTAAAALVCSIVALAAFALINQNNLMRMEEAAVHKGYGVFDKAGNFFWK